MCPVCLTTAMLIAGSVTASGGIAAIAIRKFAAKNADDLPPTQSPTQGKEDQHG
jgi:hypothetical protein